MITRFDTTIRLPRLLISLFVLASLIVPTVQPSFANRSVAAQEEVELDLPSMVLTAEDLEKANLPGFGLSVFGDLSSGWRSLGDAAIDSPAGNFLCCATTLDNLNLDLSRTGWKRQYRRILARPLPDNPSNVSVVVFTDIAEYADAEGADTALTLLMENGSTEKYTDVIKGDRLEGRTDFVMNLGGRVILAFRHDNLIGTVQIVNAEGGDFENINALLLPRLLHQRVISALARPKTGLSSAALHLAGFAIPAEDESYLRLNRKNLRGFGESPEDEAARAEPWANAVDVYYLLYRLVPRAGQTAVPWFSNRLLRFGNEQAAVTWLEALPQGLEDDVATAGGRLAIDPVPDARTFGDASLTYKIRDEVDGKTIHGYRIYVRLGRYAARMQFDGGEEQPLATIEALAAEQTACFEAGRCTGEVSLRQDTETVSCPPIASSNLPRLTDSARETESVPMLGADSARTGVHPGPGPSDDPHEDWHVTVAGEGRNPVIANGLAYFSSRDAENGYSTLYAVNTVSGEQSWCVTTGWTSTDPSFGNGLIFAGAHTIRNVHQQDFIVALSATTGEERWRFAYSTILAFGDPSTTAVDGTVYLSTPAGSLFAIDESTGTGRWLFKVSADESDEYDLGLPAITDDTVYVAGGRTLYALDSSSGAELWRFVAEDQEETLGTPTVVDDTVYIGGTSAIYAIDALTGDLRWESSSRSNGGSRLAVTGGTVYVGTGSATEPSGEATIAAFDAKTGEVIWRIETEGFVSTPAIVDDVLYLGTGIQRSDDEQDGAVVAISTDDGAELWTYPVAGIASAPVVIDGHVYVTATTIHGDSAEQTLYAIG